MYVPLRDVSAPIQIKIQWDENTAKGFAVALVVTFLLIFLSSAFHIEPPRVIDYSVNTIPLELINFGEGDGTGLSKGNLADEGKSTKGEKPMSDIHDAEVAAKTKYKKNAVTDNPDNADSFVPKDELSSNQASNDDARGSSSRNVGIGDGSDNGTGLGEKGLGPGLGPGIGPIDWGGGGNRTVLYKRLPKYPKGVNTSAEIKIRFTVSQDGTVIKMLPLQKGEPALEKAAMSALKQWRFNPLKEDKQMYGIITFTFKLS